MKKLRLDYIRGMLATCRSRMLCLHFDALKKRNCNFTCCFVWTWNFASHSKGKGIEWECSSWGDFVCTREEVRGGGRKSHNEVIHNWYSSPNTVWVIKSRRLIWVGHVVHTGVKRSASRILMGKPAVMRPLGRPRRRWKDNIKTDLKETGWESIGWIDLA